MVCSSKSFDAGIASPVQVAGRVFNDLNANGIMDPDESLIAGATINVVATDSVGTPVPGGANERLLSSNGTYSVSLPPGTYTATIVPPTSGDYWLSPLPDEQVAVGNDFTPNHTTLPVTLLSGDDGLGRFDAGLFEKVSLHTKTFNDANGNGVRDSDEGGYTGYLIVKLSDISPNAEGRTEFKWMAENTHDGSVTFPSVKPGNYQLKFFHLDQSLSFSPQHVGTDDCSDSDVDPESGIVYITVVGGKDVVCVSAGIVPGVAVDESHDGLVQ